MNSRSNYCEVIFQTQAATTVGPLSSLAVDVYCAFLVVLIIAATGGNTLVIIAIVKFRNMRTRSNAYITSLALSDVCVALILMPLHTYEAWEGMWDLPMWTCYVRNVLDGGLCGVSVLNLCVLAFDRYLAVCHPFLQMKVPVALMVCAIALSWLLPLLAWTIFFMIGRDLVGAEDYDICLMETKACVNISIWSIYSTFTALVLSFVLPSVLMIFVYLSIFATAKRHVRAIQNLDMTEEDKKKSRAFKKETKAAITLGIIVGVFFICWMPIYVAISVDVVTHFQVVPYLVLRTLVCLAYLNSMMNPVLYYILSQEFKCAFRRLLNCSDEATDFSLSQTH